MQIQIMARAVLVNPSGLIPEAAGLGRPSLAGDHVHLFAIYLVHVREKVWLADAVRPIPSVRMKTGVCDGRTFAVHGISDLSGGA